MRLKTLRKVGLCLPNTRIGYTDTTTIMPTRTDDIHKDPERVPTARRQVPRNRARGLSGKRTSRPAGHGANLGPFSQSRRTRPSLWRETGGQLRTHAGS